MSTLNAEHRTSYAAGLDENVHGLAAGVDVPPPQDGCRGPESPRSPDLFSPGKRVRAEVGVETVWVGATVYPDCPVWRVWFDGRLVMDTSTLGFAPQAGAPLICGMRMVAATRHRVQTGLGAGREARVRFAARDGRELEARVRVTDMSAFCLVRLPRSRTPSGADWSVTRFPEGSVLWGEEDRCNAQRSTLNTQRSTLHAEGEPQVRFVPSGKVVAFWRHGVEQHLVFFDRPGDLAQRRFGALDVLAGLDVPDGRGGIDRLFQTIPFTKAPLPAAVFGDCLTPAYRAAFEWAVSADHCDDFWVMRGEPGQFMVVARRQGAVWTVGGMTAAPRTLTVRFEDLWLRTPAEARALRYTVNILRDPLPGETGGEVRESFVGQAPDVRVALDLARDGGFLLEFREEIEPTDADEVCGTVLTFAVPTGAVGRLDAWLANQDCGLSRARVQALIKAGFVTCGGSAVKANDKIKTGQVFDVVVPPPEPAVPAPEDIPLSIVHEDGDLLVLDKPPGLVVHPAPGHATGTLVNALLWHCRDLGGVGGVERPGIVHRLDKDTSGLLVVAKNDAAMAGLVGLFQSGGIAKEYLALVHGVPPKMSGTVSSLIGRHPSSRKKMAVVQRNGKRAVTHYAVERVLGGLSLVRCRIETGRTHQIRVHMRSLGCPIAGDGLYGSLSADKRLPALPQRQMLHAARLAFKHPLSGKEMVFEAPLPADFAAILRVMSQNGVESNSRLS